MTNQNLIRGRDTLPTNVDQGIWLADQSNVVVDINDQWLINCDVVYYREKEGWVNSLTFLYLNQQALRLTVKMVYERRSATRNLWSVAC